MEYQGSTYNVKGHIIYEGYSEGESWRFEEWILKFPSDTKYLENDEGTFILWQAPSGGVPAITDESNNPIEFNVGAHAANAAGARISLRRGQKLLVNGLPMQIEESEVVKVVSSDSDDLDVDEKVWYIDLFKGDKRYTIELYENGEKEISEGRMVIPADFEWAKTQASTPLQADYDDEESVAFAGSGKKGNWLGVGAIVGLLALSYAFNFFQGDSEITRTCQECVNYCGDLNNPSTTWQNVTQVDCNECKLNCVDDGRVNRDRTFRSRYIHGSRSYGYDGGGGK